MKTTLKRTLSYILVVCMLLSVIPFAASAADYSYTDADLKAGEVIKRDGNADSGWTTKYDGYLRLTLDNKALDGYSFQALEFTEVAAGTYNITIKAATISQIYTFAFYAFDSSLYEAAGVTNTSGKIDYIADNIMGNDTYKLGTYASAKKGETDITITLNNVTVTEAPIFVIASDVTDGVKAYMDITNIDFVAAGSGETTAPEETTTPAETIPPVESVEYTPEQLLAMYEAGGSINDAGGVKITTTGELQKQFAEGSLTSYFAILFEDFNGIYDLTFDWTDGRIGANMIVVAKSDIDAIIESAENASGTIEGIIAKLEATGSVGALAATGSSPATSSTVRVTFSGDAGNDYYVFLQTANGGAKKLMKFTGASLTYVGAASEAIAVLNGSENLNSVDAVLEALAVSGNTVKLLKDIDLGNTAVLNSGAILDLNGKSVSGDSAALVTVSGNGSVATAPMNVAAGYIALANGNAYTVTSCAVSAAATETVGNNVKFFFRVKLGDNGAYALAAADAAFEIGAQISANGGAAVTAKFDKSWDLYSDWATAMLTDDGTVAFCITIMNAADYNIALTPVVDSVSSNAM